MVFALRSKPYTKKQEKKLFFFAKMKAVILTVVLSNRLHCQYGMSIWHVKMTCQSGSVKMAADCQIGTAKMALSEWQLPKWQRLPKWQVFSF